MQFSLDHKRLNHKQNQCSSSDSDGFMFTKIVSLNASDNDSDYDSVASENQPLTARNSDSRHSESKPVELYFNRTRSNFIHGLCSTEFGNRTKSNSHKV